MEYPIKVTRSKYHRAALKVLNCFLDLTDLEIDIIATMLQNEIKVLDTRTRIELRELLDKSENSFNNYIKKLKDKGVLIDTSYGLAINPNITNPIIDQEIVVKFKVDAD